LSGPHHAARAQVNGSNIRPWWIHHHYWAMVTTALVLALPVDSAAVQAFVRKLLWWSCFQARGSGAPHQRYTVPGGPAAARASWAPAHTLALP